MQLTVYWWTQWYFPTLVAQQRLISYSAVIWYMDTWVCRRDAEKSDHGSGVYKVWYRCATTEEVEQEISWAQCLKPAWVTSPPQYKLLDDYNPHFFLSKSSQSHASTAPGLPSSSTFTKEAWWWLQKIKFLTLVSTCVLLPWLQYTALHSERAGSRGFPSTECLTLAHLPLRSLALWIYGSGSLGEKLFVTR